jgi:hypothetical protein
LFLVSLYLVVCVCVCFFFCLEIIIFVIGHDGSFVSCLSACVSICLCLSVSVSLSLQTNYSDSGARWEMSLLSCSLSLCPDCLSKGD